MFKKLVIIAGIFVAVIASSGLLLKNESIAQAQPVVASVDWVLEQLAPYSDRISSLEDEIDRLEAEVNELKNR
ncbi:hypothetical protein JCM19037_790 [Geomicrobium sp. JCM 19037]|uniref:hypothetical protein n=1 Tax=Geomicrobium sp. JCM 19037 TaxID=1460634 RepID=UPI00045F1955|nr:hypothetical protein [Geomicrobium sp. JCM 19037]GAK02549.1 hypothetical protein JCM19037_790 [Geomicrobium sp. JCM 19037]